MKEDAVQQDHRLPLDKGTNPTEWERTLNSYQYFAQSVAWIEPMIEFVRRLSTEECVATLHPHTSHFDLVLAKGPLSDPETVFLSLEAPKHGAWRIEIRSLGSSRLSAKCSPEVAYELLLAITKIYVERY
jgi:hypothetical protein